MSNPSGKKNLHIKLTANFDEIAATIRLCINNRWIQDSIHPINFTFSLLQKLGERPSKFYFDAISWGGFFVFFESVNNRLSLLRFDYPLHYTFFGYCTQLIRNETTFQSKKKMYEKIELIAPSLHQSFTIRGRSLLDCFINVHFVIPIVYFRQFRIVLSIVNIYIEIAVEVWLKVNHSHFRAVLVGILQFSSKLETKLKNMVLARCHQ